MTPRSETAGAAGRHPQHGARRLTVYVPEFLPTSETFVYNAIQAASAWQPSVLCHRRTNSDRFPLAQVPVQSTPAWAYQLHARATGRGRFVRRVSDGVLDLRCAAAMRRSRSSLMLAHFGPAALSVRRAARMAGVPLAVVFHGYDATQMLTGTTFEQAYPGLAASADLIVAVSDFVRERLLAAGAPADKTRTHYWGIPVPPREARPSFSGTVLQVGRLTQGKGHETTLRAFALALERHPSLILRLVGDGPLRPRLQQLTAELRIERQVSFLGDLPAAAVHAELRRADVFVHPSSTSAQGWSEGLGLAIVEAMARELPVVATQHGGIPEVVTDRTGILVGENHAEALAAAVTALIERPQLRSALGSAGRERVEERFDIVPNTRRLEALFDIASRPQPPARHSLPATARYVGARDGGLVIRTDDGDRPGSCEVEETRRPARRVSEEEVRS